MSMDSSSTPPPMPMTAPMGYAPPGKAQTMKPMIGGILLIVSAIVGISFWAYLAFTIDAFVQMIPIMGEALRGIVIVCGAIMILFGLLGLLGGIMAIRRRMWALGIVGAILGLFTFGWYGLSSLLALIALIFLAMSRSEF